MVEPAEPCCAAPRGSASPGPSAPERSSTDPGRQPRPAEDPVARTPLEALDLVEIPGGSFTMGTDDRTFDAGDGEGPAHEVELDGFRIGRTAVTNELFGAFVASTGYRTTAEELGSSFVFGGLLPADAAPTRGVVGAPWWREVLDASWRRPEGPDSDVDGRGDHPAVHLTWFDAVAFCDWAGARLPTEAEWERAARGGIAGVHFPWGDEREPAGEHLMNVFQGDFPSHDRGDDGWAGTCPVASFPPNGFGLHEVTGNVWEWNADWFSPDTYRRGASRNPVGPPDGTRRVMRGGSYLCHDSYCRRYRVDARSSNAPDSSSGNLGLRVAADLDASTPPAPQ